MKLKRFLLRYYPPGIILEYEQGGELRNKPVDLLSLSPDSDVEALVDQVVRQEALVSESRKPQVRDAVSLSPPRRSPHPPSTPPPILASPPLSAAFPHPHPHPRGSCASLCTS